MVVVQEQLNLVLYMTEMCAVFRSYGCNDEKGMFKKESSWSRFDARTTRSWGY